MGQVISLASFQKQVQSYCHLVLTPVAEPVR